MSADLKNWEITVEGVTAEDMKDLAEKAGAHGLTIGGLLGNFINDLVDGQATNGSDERMYARQWFDRCWFGMFPEETFLRYLVEWGSLDDVLDAWKGIRDSEEYVKQIEEELATGEIVSHSPEYKGECYSWKDIVNSDGEPCYQSKEAWEADERETLQDEKEHIADCRETLAELWKEYMESGTGDYSPGTFDEEIKKVLEWAEKHQKFLD